jgi:hypothetical protein
LAKDWDGKRLGHPLFKAPLEVGMDVQSSWLFTHKSV